MKKPQRRRYDLGIRFQADSIAFFLSQAWLRSLFFLSRCSWLAEPHLILEVRYRACDTEQGALPISAFFSLCYSHGCKESSFELSEVRSSTLSLPTEDQRRSSICSHHKTLIPQLPEISQYSWFRADSQQYSSINNKYLYLRIDNGTMDESWQFDARAFLISPALSSDRQAIEYANQGDDAPICHNHCSRCSSIYSSASPATWMEMERERVSISMSIAPSAFDSLFTSSPFFFGQHSFSFYNEPM